MARSWERMVQRNTQQINKRRKKEGKDSINSSSKAGQTDVYKGRNIVFPVLLAALGALYWIIGQFDTSSANQNSLVMNWVGVVLYFALAAMIFFRRPYLKVERARVSTFKFNRQRFLEATDIEKIIISRRSISIKPKAKRGHWIFSRLINRYDTAVMGERMERFGQINHIPVERE
ncbi:hypothetical protein SAMN04487895_101311 [Paenibacillus sophorae]|uniref:Uncharacterized protein n=1 Tax=Paenibacillus sophorae TaxID=1333845 RepID=A0A1H8G080_9BACL|nr:hypothetical protein [Paenibacillus sophorae]QWU14037.1 hypothetical protein KP014_19110 [Paenibacillus sophorae]SEN37185.1 hypothetical protein SAMN04487895_101311 [Paenibacillus sophorae]